MIHVSFDFQFYVVKGNKLQFWYTNSQLCLIGKLFSIHIEFTSWSTLQQKNDLLLKLDRSNMSGH